MFKTGAATVATYNTTTGAVVINGAAAATAVYFYPSQPVMGIGTYEQVDINNEMVIAFDNMKVIHNYRTPVTLRSYSKVFIYIFPIIYGPYFASTFTEYDAHLEYVMPVLYSFILVSLDNIQDHLENPFDEVGEDDIVIDAHETTELLQ